MFNTINLIKDIGISVSIAKQSTWTHCKNIIAECSEAVRLGQAFNNSLPLTFHCKAINEEIREEKDCLHCSQFSVYKDKVEVCDW